MRVAVFARDELSDELTAAERAELGRLGYTGPRAAEWIAGRAAAHKVIGDVDVTSRDDGSPNIPHGVLSISHDGEWVAVAAAERGRVAVDLCERKHAARLSRILARLGVRSGDPCLTWAALECALKLRGQGVWTLLDRVVAVEPRGDRAVVHGIGGDVEVSWRAGAGYVLAWAELAVMASPAAGTSVVSGLRLGPAPAARPATSDDRLDQERIA